VIYEWRVYEAMPGRMANLQARFRDHTARIFERHGYKLQGFWTPTIGDFSDRLYYLVAYDDLADRDRARAAVEADPEFQRVIRESEANGPLVKSIHNTIMKPTDFSPVQ